MLRHTLLIIIYATTSILSVSLDIDGYYQPERLAANSLDPRWRCLGSHLEKSIALSLDSDYNYTGLGWKHEYVRPLIANLTGCIELAMDDLHGGTSLPPLAMALTAACPVGADQDPNRWWEPPKSFAPLRVLDFEGSTLEDGGAALVAPVLHACPSIEQVYLPANRIGDDGVRLLANGLISEPTVDGRPPLTPWQKPITPTSDQGVKLLDLHANNFGDFGADGLARMLMLPPPPKPPLPLTDLRLHANRIGPLGFSLLAEGLRDNVILHTLMLSRNPGGDEGVRALADAMVNRKEERPSGLRRLFLSSINMTDVGAAALLEALREPLFPPLEQLVIDGNPAISAPLLNSIAAAVAARSGVVDSGPPADGSRTTGVFRTLVEPRGEVEEEEFNPRTCSRCSSRCPHLC